MQHTLLELIWRTMLTHTHVFLSEITRPLVVLQDQQHQHAASQSVKRFQLQKIRN